MDDFAADNLSDDGAEGLEDGIDDIIIDEDPAAVAPEDIEEDADADPTIVAIVPEIAAPQIEYSTIDYYVHPDDRMTPFILNKFEQTEAISVRATNIEQEGSAFIETGNLTDSLSIAKKELILRRNPLMVYRRVGHKLGPDGKMHNVYECMNVNDMDFSIHYDI